MPGEYLPPVVTRLTGDIDDLIKKVEEAKAAIKSLGSTNVKVGFDIDNASLARAQAAAKAAFSNGVTMPVRFDVQGAGGALARGAGFGALGWLVGLAGRGVNLFGGVLPGFLGSVGAIHLAIDLALELVAVVGPAMIAMGAFGIAASDAAKNIYNEFTAIHTVMDATGKTIPPMTDAMEKLHQAVQPQVYSMLGDALTVINNKAGEFSQIAQGAASVFSYFAARITVALTSSGMSAFLKNAVSDLRGLFNVFGNIAGTVGAVLKNLPGYAQVFLNVLQTVTHGVEVFANSGFGQGITRFGLAFHGAFIYLGILGTAVARIIPMILGWVTRLGDAAALQAVRLGFTRIADGLAAISGGAEEAAALPWGWIGLVAAGFGVLAYKIMTAKDANQEWLASLQQTIGNMGAGAPGQAALAAGQVSVLSRLTGAQMGLNNAQQHGINTQVMYGHATRTANISLAANQQNVSDYKSGLTQVNDETNLYNSRLGVLAQKYGGAREAQNLLQQSGVKMSQMLDKSSQAWKIIQQQVSGLVQGYAAMAQRGGTLGADLFVITQQASDQYQAMQKLNQAWQTFIQQTSSLQSSAENVITAIRTMAGEANKAHTSFTGVNASSIQLQGTFEQQLYPQLQNVISGMRQGGAQSGDMAKAISTLLSPAVHEGALQNAGLRTQIYDMARQANYTGPNAIGPLTHFIDNNRTSLYNAMLMVDRYTKQLGNIPNPENLSVHVVGKGQFSVVGTGPFAGKVTSVGGAARGAYVSMGTSGTADDVLARVSRGELIVPASMVKGGAVDHLRGRIPGFAAGGFVPNYSGSVGGLGPWVTQDYTALLHGMASTIASSTASAMANTFMGGGGGRASAGGQYNRAMLENLWQQAGGPGGYIALTAAAIALAESGGNPLARNPSGASGLWQILGQVVGGNIFNPFTNALNAVSKFDSAGGFSPWVTYTTGAYRAYMDQGGWLQPGNTLVTNNTGKPELVTPMDHLGGGDIIINIDGQQVFRVMQKHARRFNRRNGPKGSNKAFLPG